MRLYPAIDLQQGKCVRLRQGNLQDATIFNHDPAAQARLFAAQGAEYLHIVDLDGAVAGQAVNRQAVLAIREATSLPLQLGGGIRSLADIENWLVAGVTRVIIGTLAVQQPELVKEAAQRYPYQIVLGLDCRAGYLAIKGWEETTQIQALSFVRQFETIPLAAIVFTDIQRDGVGLGVNGEATHDLANSTPIPVIASGGVANLDDISKLARAGIVEGVIIGRALYDKQFTLSDALAAAKLAAKLTPRLAPKQAS